MDVEQAWQVFKNIVINAAKQVCITVRYTRNKKPTADWSDEIIAEVKKKERCHKSQMMRLKIQSINVKNLLLETIERTLVEFGRHMEDKRKENQKLFYIVLKRLRQGKQETVKNVKDKKGNWQQKMR